MIEFKNIPFPPSTNQLHSDFVRRGVINRCRSPRYNEYKRDFAGYILRRSLQFEEARSEVQKWFGENMVCAIEFTFYYNKKALYTVDGKVKRNDVSNRIKALEDCFFEALNIDDRFVFQIIAKKDVTTMISHATIGMVPIALPVG